jgi:hypothetical protein
VACIQHAKASIPQPRIRLFVPPHPQHSSITQLNPNPQETAFVKELFPDLTVVPRTASLHGSWTDDDGEVPEKYIDLFTGSLYAESRTADLELGIELAGLHPEGQQVHTQFEVFFDTDNDTGTGSTVALFSGIDQILKIELEGIFASHSARPTEAPAPFSMR